MTLRTASTAFLLVSLLFSSCGGASKHEAAAAESISLMEQIGNTLETVKDEASAKAAAGKLEPIMARMAAIKTEMEALPKPAEKADAELAAKHDARMQAAMTKMTANLGRVMMDPKMNAILEPVLSKMGK